MNIATTSSAAIHKSDTFEVHWQADGMTVSRRGVPLESFDIPTAVTLIMELAAKMEQLQSDLDSARAENARFVGQNASLALTARTMTDRYENANRLSIGTAELLMRARESYREQLGALKTEVTQALSGGMPGHFDKALPEALARLLEPVAGVF